MAMFAMIYQDITFLLHIHMIDLSLVNETSKKIDVTAYYLLKSN